MQSDGTGAGERTPLAFVPPPQSGLFPAHTSHAEMHLPSLREANSAPALEPPGPMQQPRPITLGHESRFQPRADWVPPKEDCSAPTEKRHSREKNVSEDADEDDEHAQKAQQTKKKQAQAQDKKNKDTSSQFDPRTALDRFQWWLLYPPQLGTQDQDADGEEEIGSNKLLNVGGMSKQPRTINQFREDRISFLRRIFAEFLGTTIFVFAIAGLKIRASLGSADALGATLGSGLCLGALIFCLGTTCGAHFNPVVSLAFFLRRSFPGRWLLAYWIAQFCGALLAAGFLRSLFSYDQARMGNNYPENGYSTATVLWVETLMTFMFVFVILVLSKKGGVSGANAALGIGFTFAWVLLFMAGIDGGGLNPFRSLCPAILSGPLNVVWPFIIGPILGTIVAVGCMWILFGRLTIAELQTAQGSGDD